MAYNEKLADRIREALVDTPKTLEKQMFGGVCFMVDNKMCVGRFVRSVPTAWQELSVSR